MKVERNGPVLVRRNYSLEAEPPSGRITFPGKLDSFASEGLGLAVKQDLGGDHRLAAKARLSPKPLHGPRGPNYAGATEKANSREAWLRAGLIHSIFS
jgi:hypothetical protein